jgi:hypothetical protein
MNAKTWKTWSLDKSRIYDGLVFATPGERCRYIGTWVRDRPQWLKKNVGRWRRIEDVQQEAASPAPPVESEVDLGAEPAGPNGQTSSGGVQDNGGDEGDVALVDTLSGDCSLPCQQTSLPTPVTATLTSWSTKAELLPPAKAAMSETRQPKTETTPLGAVGAAFDQGCRRRRPRSSTAAASSAPNRNITAKESGVAGDITIVRRKIGPLTFIYSPNKTSATTQPHTWPAHQFSAPTKSLRKLKTSLDRVIPIRWNEPVRHAGAGCCWPSMPADQQRKRRLIGLRIATAKKAVSKSMLMIVAKMGSQLPVAS